MSETSNQDPFGPELLDDDSGKEFLVVGLGASAGGITALRDFFAHVPADSGMAYVVILHLSPDHDSQLASVLQRVSAIPVTQVEHRVRVEPNHVYVIPPNKSLEMDDGLLRLSNVTSSEVRRAPVDIFFRTLAEAHGARAVSVVLSGTGANGSMGMKRVKEMGGLCIVQDPQEAEYGDMTRHSLATGLVDYVLPAARIPAQIIAYREQLKRLDIAAGEPEPPEAEAHLLRDIFKQLKVRTKHDFSNYKRPTVLRRIARRMGVNQLTTLAAYAQFIHEHPQEADALLKDLLISVTNFFRDPASFEKLERDIIPKLFKDKGVDDYVRVWAAGCATGEEAYTVAMMLADYSSKLPSPPQIQVFATDIDEDAVAVARDGYYTLNDSADVPPERLSRFFTREGDDGYRVRREIRERVLFAVHNVIKDPPFAHLDLATCRNLLIYLNTTAQRRVLDVLHFALNPGGYLMLGTSESTDGASELFLVVDKEHRIYQGRAVENRILFPVPDGSLLTRLGKLPQIRRGSEHRAAPNSHALLHQQLLERYAPPSVVVSEDYDVIHMSESAGRFMGLRGGELSPNLLHLVRPELRLELRAALYQATHKKTDSVSRAVPVRVGDETKSIQIRVRPALGESDAARGFFLVLFEDSAAAPEPEQVVVRSVGADEESLARKLEEELLEVKAQLTITIEQYEIQREELKASNEELQAMNEEMRSAAEELETSKEELQSINEELTTVNQELKVRIEELSQTTADFKNLLNSTQIGTVFLDRGLRVKLFTPRARDIFNFIPADVGRPLSDITNSLDDDTRLIADAEAVLDRLRPVERVVRTNDGRAYLMQVTPYRSSDDRIEGVVVTFLDITDRDRAEEFLRQSEEQLRHAIQDAPVPVIMHAEDGEVLQISGTWTELTGYTLEDVPTFDSWLTRAYGEGADGVRQHVQELFKGDRRTLNVEFPVRTRRGDVRLWSFSASSPGTLRDGRRFIVGMALDITAERDARTRQLASETRLKRAVEDIIDYAVIMLDAEGFVEMWNTGAERIFGFTAEEAVGQHTEFIFIPEDRRRGAHLKEMQQAREHGRATDERWHIRKDGTRIFLSGVLSPSGDSTPTGFVKIARDLTERKRADEELRRAYDELEDRVRERTSELAQANVAMRDEISERIRTERKRVRLLRQIVRAQEDERRRIARDIHDQLGQQTTALRLNLDSLLQGCDDAELRRKVEQAQAIAERLDADVDFLAWELRPAALDDLGLLAALGNFVREWSRHSGIAAEFHTTGMESERLSPEAESALYRITQEALNNAMKYARASRVDVLLERRDQQVVLIVEDDGVGFDPQQELTSSKGMGLVGMRERALLVGGALEIESAPGEGTAVFVRVPVRFDEEEGEEQG